MTVRHTADTHGLTVDEPPILMLYTTLRSVSRRISVCRRFVVRLRVVGRFVVVNVAITPMTSRFADRHDDFDVVLNNGGL